ncbi:MAG: tetratricopeptide repeat protein [Deltaproteobacteria bacterium]
MIFLKYAYKASPVRLKAVLMLALLAFAVSSCANSLAQRKEESVIHYKLGTVHLKDRDYPAALKELTNAIEMYEGEPSYHNALGLAYFARGMNKEAEKAMKEAVSIDPKFSEARVNLSAVYLAEKRWDDAIEESKTALKNIFYRTPEFAYFNMAQAYLNKTDHVAAIEGYKKAVEINPNYALAYYSMGLVFDRMNNVRDAADAFEKAVKAAPSYSDAHFELGKAFLKQRQNARALKAFEKVVELAPESEFARSSKEFIKLLK